MADKPSEQGVGLQTHDPHPMQKPVLIVSFFLQNTPCSQSLAETFRFFLLPRTDRESAAAPRTPRVL
jgi:hypothetical protein